MPKPTAAEVNLAVRTFVAGAANMNLGQVTLSLILRDPPLALDDNDLVFLATSLRGYVKRFKDSATVRAADTKRAGVTVGALASVVLTRL